MKKKIISLLMTLVMVVGMIGVMPAVSAGAESSGYWEYRVLDDGTAEITRYTGNMTTVSVPSYIDGRSVSSIGNRMYYYIAYPYPVFGDDIVSVTLPNSINTIGKCTFNGCSNLISVTMPKYVTSIQYKAFCGCKKLNSITATNVKVIGESAFEGCESLTSVKIPGNVTVIDNYTFKNCKSLKSVTISSGVKTIGEESFLGCSITNISFPNTITSIGKRAFYDNLNLKSVTLNKNIASIGYESFGCYNNGNVWGGKVSNFKIKCYANTAGYNYAKDNEFKYEVLDRIGTVSGFKTSAISSTAVKLTWNKVSGAQGYIVYKYNNAKKTWVRVAKTKTTANTYTVSKLASGVSYRFAVKAYKTLNGKEVTSSKFPTVTAITNLPNVVNGKTSIGKNSVKLTWKKTTGATGYIVYKYDNSKKTWVRIAKTRSLNYLVKNLKANTNYKFTVKAYKYVNGKEITSVSFIPLSVKTKK